MITEAVNSRRLIRIRAPKSGAFKRMCANETRLSANETFCIFNDEDEILAVQQTVQNRDAVRLTKDNLTSTEGSGSAMKEAFASRIRKIEAEVLSWNVRVKADEARLAIGAISTVSLDDTRVCQKKSAISLREAFIEQRIAIAQADDLSAMCDLIEAHADRALSHLSRCQTYLQISVPFSCSLKWTNPSIATAKQGDEIAILTRLT